MANGLMRWRTAGGLQKMPSALVRKTSLMKHTMWIILQLDDAKWVKEVARKAYAVIEELNGEGVKAGALSDLTIRVAFPHRQAKRLEKAIASALSKTPVKRTTVYTTNPFAIRRPRGAY